MFADEIQKKIDDHYDAKKEDSKELFDLLEKEGFRRLTHPSMTRLEVKNNLIRLKYDIAISIDNKEYSLAVPDRVFDPLVKVWKRDKVKDLNKLVEEIKELIREDLKVYI